jgi:hypothetical protein
MTELKNNLKPLTDKNAQLVTCGIFYCRDSAEINGCGSLQTLSWFDSDVLRNRQQKHTAIRYTPLPFCRYRMNLNIEVF